jgi:regulation of enolase protein 1 (concanavalin A-like superfamily)
MARTGSEFLISARLGDMDWTQLRMVRLACEANASLAVGPYACSPKGVGFRCVFTELALDPQYPH